MGDLTRPHASVDEKFAGFTKGPVKNIEGKSTKNIKALNVRRYKIRIANRIILNFILLKSFRKPRPKKIKTITTRAD